LYFGGKLTNQFKLMKFTVYDEDGLFSIVNTHRYSGFVNEDWSLEQLFEHFVSEMNNQNLIVWKTNNDGGGEWIMEVLEDENDTLSLRQFKKTIEVTGGSLHLVSYTDLTMAAQFDDEKLPSKENSTLEILLENGKYDVTVKQLFNPDDYDYDDTASTSFQLIFKSVNSSIEDNVIKNIFWW
jgi:hypothetical protein